MPFTHSFQSDPLAFVILRAAGQVRLVTWADAMREVIADPRFRPAMPILLDASEVTEPPGPGDPAIIAATWRLLTPHSRGGAIVTSAGVMFGAAHQVQQLSGNWVRAFTDVPSALQWLQNPYVAGGGVAAGLGVYGGNRGYSYRRRP